VTIPPGTGIDPPLITITSPLPAVLWIVLCVRSWTEPSVVILGVS